MVQGVSIVVSTLEVQGSILCNTFHPLFFLNIVQKRKKNFFRKKKKLFRLGVRNPPRMVSKEGKKKLLSINHLTRRTFLI